MSLARNPVVFKFSSDNVVQTPGVHSKSELTFHAAYPMADGDSFKITWGNILNAVHIVAKNSPDDSGTQIKTIVGGQSQAFWINQTANYLAQNYFISRDFNILPLTTSIVLLAKETGDVFDITLSDEDASQVTIALSPAGTDEVLREFFSIILQSFMKVWDTYTQVFQDALSVWLNGSTAYNGLSDLSEILKSYLSSSFEFPESSTFGWIKRPEINQPYYIRFAEQFGNPLMPQALHTSRVYFALNGGVPYWKQAEYYAAGSSFFDRQATDMQFLTWQPKEKSINRTQVEKLYFLAWKEGMKDTMCKLRIAMHYYNGGVLTLETGYSAPFAVSFMDVFELEVGYKKLDALYSIGTYFNHDNPEGSAGQYYEVDVIINAGQIPITEKRRFNIDMAERPNTRYFLFLNSLGGFDTFRSTGIAELTDDYERTFITQSWPKEFEAAFRQRKQVFVTGNNKVKCNTGWITNEVADYLQDMLLSEEAYEIINDKLYVINITSTSVRRYADEEAPTCQFDFEYDRAAHESTYAVSQEVIGGGGDYDPEYFEENEFNTL